MNNQLQIVFTSSSPINADSFNQQHNDIVNHLMSGSTLNRYEAGRLYKIGTLHSRIAEVAKVLLDQYGVKIERKLIKAKNYFDQDTNVMQYWLSPESIKKLSGDLKVAA